MQDFQNMIEKMRMDFKGYMQEEIMKVKPDIDPDPSLGLIKELLGEVPGQIEEIQGKAIQVKKFMMDYKLMVKSMKTNLEMEKSRIRLEIQEEYQEKTKKFIIEAKELINDVGDGKKKLPTAMVQELLKAIKPEKPTQNFLDDVANMKTKEQQEKIISIEKQLNEIEAIYGMLETLAIKYENKFISTRAHKNLKEAEMRNSLQ